MDPVPLLDLRAQLATMRDEVVEALLGIVDSQSFVLGPVVERFEREAAALVGAGHAVGCASGTDALILALAALDVGPGDEVVTSPFSFFATASCAYKVGARPVFVDIDPDTFNLDPSAVEAAVTPRTRAIVPVHLFGQCAAMDPILDLAATRRIPVVEDAAQAFGASYDSAGRGRVSAGCLGEVGCFSFFPSKNLGGYGDGGMLVTNDAGTADRLRSLRVHGETERYHHRWVGWNSRLDALQAAVLRVKLPRLRAWCDARRAHADRYDRLFTQAGATASGAIRIPARAERSEHIFNQYTIRVEGRDELLAHLRQLGIGHAVYYPVPLHLQECFRDLGYRPGDLPRAEAASREVVSLPVYPELSEAAQERVVSAVVEFCRGRARVS